MSATIIDDLGPMSADALDAAAAKLGVSLPDDYRSFMLRHNGGRPQPDGFDIAWKAGQEGAAAGKGSYVSWFFSVYDEPDENLLVANQIDFRGRLPPGTLAIARDPGGNLLLLRVGGARRGEVVYWLKELEGRTQDDAGLGFVADSFDAFLGLLR